MKIVLKLGILLGLLSCGAELPRETSYTESSTGEPFEYEYFQAACTDGDKLDLQATPKIKLFINGQYQSVQMEKVVNEKLISQVLLGGIVEGGLYQDGKLKIRQKSRDFEYCFKASDLADNHYEDAALSILDPLNKFENRFMDIIRENNISKINVRVLPRYAQVNSNRTGTSHNLNKTHLINNAMYSAKRKEIIFLPQGRNTQGFIPFGGVPLWKQPMVTLHEYGHHFFRSILGGKIVKDPGELCIDNRHQLEHPDTLESSSDLFTVRDVDVDDAVGAINEAFADLFSFYANIDNKNLKNFGCMEKTRDVSSKMFISGNEKRLSRDVLDIFLSTEKRKANPCIIEPNYQDIHIIGAIFAFGFNKLLEHSNASKLEKLKLLLEWSKSISQLHAKNPTTESFLNFAAINFYKLSLNKFPELGTKCNYFFATFPEASYNCQ